MKPDIITFLIESTVWWFFLLRYYCRDVRGGQFKQLTW